MPSLKFRLIFLFTFLLFIPWTIIGQNFKNSSGKISLIEKNCPDFIPPRKCLCDATTCNKAVFNFNSNYYLEFIQSDTEDKDMEECYDCYTLKLHLNSSIISMDSIYFSGTQVRDLPFIPGFVEGKYSIKNNLLKLILVFINENIHSSRPLVEKFTIDFNVKTNKYLYSTAVEEESE